MRRPAPRFLVTLASVTLIGPLALHAFLPVMPEVKSEFGISDALAGLTFSISLFIIAFATLVYGSLSDRYGRRPVLLAGLALFTLGSIVSALSSSVTGLLVGRIIQALGAGGSGGLARAIARDTYGTDVLVKVIAYLTMAYALGPMIAPVAAGLLVDSTGWRGAFWFAALAGALIAAAAYVVLYETHAPEHRAQRGSSFLHDYVRLFSHLRFTAFVLQSGFSTGCFFAMAAANAFLMKDYLGRSATEFSMYFLAFPAGYFLGNLASSRLSQRVALENMVLAGTIVNVLAVASQSLALLAGYVTPLVLFIPGFLITFGQGLALPNTQVGAMRVIPSLAGTASGIGAFCQMFLGALFVQIYTWLADGTPVPLVITVASASVLVLAMGVIPVALKARNVT